MDQWGPKHVELHLKFRIKLVHWEHCVSSWIISVNSARWYTDYIMSRSQTKIKTHIFRPVTFFLFLENHAVFEIRWNTIVEKDRSHMKIWRMSITCWIPKVKHTHIFTICNTYCFPLRQGLQEGSSFLPSTYVACLVKSSLSSSHIGRNIPLSLLPLSILSMYVILVYLKGIFKSLQKDWEKFGESAALFLGYSLRQTFFSLFLFSPFLS
jgi:hypothetical protein